MTKTFKTLNNWNLKFICNLEFVIWNLEQNARGRPAEVKHLSKRRKRKQYRRKPDHSLSSGE